MAGNPGLSSPADWPLPLVWLGTVVQVIISTSLFFAAHLTLGLSSGIAAGLIGGFYLAFTYVRWRRRSWWTAIWVTSLSHAIGNALVSLAVVSRL